jgi:ABC-type enterochelin transport system ATPase subunit
MCPGWTSGGLVVDAVCSELVSAGISRLTGKKQGKSTVFPSIERLLVPHSAAISVTCREIPCALEQGIIRRVSGNYQARIRELLGAQQGMCAAVTN